MDRRGFMSAFLSLSGAALVLASQPSLSAIRPRRRRIRRRIRVRRRIRRRVITRIVFGRPFWVVPVALAVGWELVHEDRVVIVKETKIVERDGNKVEIAVVQDSAGKTETVEIAREDTTENKENLEGTVLPDSDKSTPGIESTIEEEADA